MRQNNKQNKRIVEVQRKRAMERKQSEAVETVREDLYTADTWSLLITEPCDCPQGVLWSSVSLSLPASVLACLCGCRHVVCVSQRVKFIAIGSGVRVCTWTSLCLAFLQADELRCKMTVRLRDGEAWEENPAANACVCLIRVPDWKCKHLLTLSLTNLGFGLRLQTVLQVCD